MMSPNRLLKNSIYRGFDALVRVRLLVQVLVVVHVLVVVLDPIHGASARRDMRSKL